MEELPDCKYYEICKYYKSHCRELICWRAKELDGIINGGTKERLEKHLKTLKDYINNGNK